MNATPAGDGGRTDGPADASWWMVSAETPEYPPLTEDLTVDVAVVGAGIAGISVASELVRRGRSVALLEAQAVAAGATGHTTAKVSALHGARYSSLEQHLGGDAARTYAESQSAAMAHLVATVDRLGIDCDLERGPAFAFTEDEGQLDTIRAEVEAAARAGLPASFTTETELPFPVAGACRVEDQLVFHPRRYLRAVVEEIAALGGRVHERTRVTALSENGRPELTTDGGARVTAEHVVVATHYPIFDRSLMFARLKPEREFAVAAAVPADVAPRGMYVNVSSDTRSLRSAPYDDGQRLLIATGSPFTPGKGPTTPHLDELVEWLLARYPMAEVRYRWAAQDTFTGDDVPFIGPLHPAARRTWVATGFGAWGMASGVLAGLLLTQRICEEDAPWAGLYDTRRLHPLLEGRTAAEGGLRTAAGLVGSRVKARLERVDSAERIPRGQAGLVHEDGRDWATFVDEGGRPHAVSPTCTHMGCLVGFNEVERSWDCPCHGSRFGLDGAVLEGPAVKPLQRREVNPTND